MAAKAQAIPVKGTWNIPWWRMAMLALVAAAAIVAAILTMQAVGSDDPVPGSGGVQKSDINSDVRPGGGSGGYDLGGGVVCHQCL